MFTARQVSNTTAAIVTACLALTPALNAAPVVWGGPSITFTKSNFSDPTNPANQDKITPNVKLTRANTEGIFNAAAESSYTHDFSPAGTEWAFPTNNPGKTVEASNWADLAFDNWEDSLNAYPPDSVGIPGVLHLIADDVYLDIQFTSWKSGGGGGFSYIRATAPEPGVAALAVAGLALVNSFRPRRQMG